MLLSVMIFGVHWDHSFLIDACHDLVFYVETDHEQYQGTKYAF